MISVSLPSQRHRTPALARWALALASALVVGTMISSTAALADSGKGAVKEYALRAGNPIGITAGPDGNIWFTTSDAKLGRITRSGHIREFAIPQPPSCTTNCPSSPPPCTTNCSPTPPCDAACLAHGQEITTGPDGNLWFTQPFSDFVGKAVLSDGGVTFAEYPAPTGCHGPFRFCMDGITAGPDGNIWFTEPSRGQVARLVPSTGAITEFPGAGFPLRITAGPDGNLWFGDPGAGGIGRITTAGVITEFPVPNPELSNGGTAPNPDGDADAGDSYGFGMNGGIAVGSDGNLWAYVEVGWIDNALSSCPTAGSDDLCSGVGVYDTSDWLVAVSPLDGTVQKGFRISGGNPQDLARGSDGKIWIPFHNVAGPSPWQPTGGMQVSSLSPTGHLTDYATRFQLPYDITAGPHQTVWFTEQGHIGRINICGDDCESEGNND
jgi:streptogramin lyase